MDRVTMPRRGKISKSHQILTSLERRLAFLEKSINKQKRSLEAAEIEADSLRRIKKLYEKETI